MLIDVAADIDCPTCFNDVIESISATPGVHTIARGDDHPSVATGARAPHADTGCLVITHDLDERELLAAITTVGHTLDIAPNGEITMGEASAISVRACSTHPQD